MKTSAAVAAITAAIYVAILVVDPLLDRRLDVLQAHPEDYAAGAFGLLVNVSYAAFAVSLASIALALFAGIRWTALAIALLIPPAVLCAALAVDPPAVARSGGWVSFAIVGLAVAPLLISITLRGCFLVRRRLTFGLAGAVLLAFLALIASPDAVGGLVNRVFDVLAGTWVGVAALAIRPEPGPLDPR